MHRPALLGKLRSLLKHKKSRKFYAEKLGVSEDEVTDLFREMRNEKRDRIRDEAEACNYISALEEKIVEHNFEAGTLKSTMVLDFEPKDIDELYRVHKVDKATYKITNYWSKLKSNGKFTSSVFATARKPTDYTAEDFANWLKNYKPAPLKVQRSYENPVAHTVDIEVSISDFHLAKKTKEEETIGRRKVVYMTTLANLVRRVDSCFKINKVVFVISNDFFHTDTYNNTTTNGTPQDVNAEFDHEYEVGFDLLVTAISYLKQMANEVEVVLVQGNHDRTKSFYVAHALDIYFKDDENVTFQRQHSTTKHVVLGNTFIGYHHGNCKIDDLPLLFATGETSYRFGSSAYKEVHTGDKHFYMAKEVKGVRIQQMPSLSGVDRWHQDNNYVNNIRAALVLIYDQVAGKIGEFEERI